MLEPKYDVNELGIYFVNRTEEVRDTCVQGWHSRHHIYATNMLDIGSERFKHLLLLLMAGRHKLRYKVMDISVILSSSVFR